MKRKILLSVIVLCIVMGAIYDVFSNATGVGGQTPAPGENTCSQAGCHASGNGENSSGGLADNTGGGAVVINGISGTYTPGTLYHLTVRVSQTGGGLFGFNCEVLDASGANAGTLMATLAGTHITPGYYGTRNTITHGHAGASGTIAGTGVDFFDFTFDWTAPALSVGPVTLYVSGLAANGDALQGAGDNVYSTTMTLNPSVAPASPLILISRTSFVNPSFYALTNTVGNVQRFDVAGQSLTGNLTVSMAGAQFMLSTTQSGPWVSSIPLTSANGVVNGTPLYVQYTGPVSGTQTGTITISGGGAAAKTIPLSGQINAPSFGAPSSSSLSFGTVNVGSGPSVVQSFTITPANQVSGLVITCPPGYEASGVPTRDFKTSLTPAFFGFSFPNTIYVRLKNPQAAGAINGNLTIATPGAVTQGVSLSATAVNPAQLVLASTDYLSLFHTQAGVPSIAQTLNVNGSGLTGNLVVSAPTNFEVSLSSGTGYGSSVSITPSGGAIAATSVYVRYHPVANGFDYGLLTIVSTGAATQNVNIVGSSAGVALTPSIVVSGSLSAFSATVGTPSAPQNLSVSASNLTANLVVSAPANFEVSLSSGSGFGSSVSIAPAAGTVSAITVYARYNPTAAGTHNGNIAVSSTSATTQNVAVNGTATNSSSAAVTATSIPNPFVTMVGTPSTQQSFNVSGVNLTANLVVTTPADFEVSLSSGNGFGASVSLSPTGGGVASTVIYARFNPASAGFKTGNITVTSAGANTQNVVVSGNQPPAVVITGTLSAFTAVVGTPSSPQSVSVSGSNLTANLVVIAPSNFDVSLSSGSGFGSSISLSPNMGTVAASPVYVRYNPLAAGSSSASLMLTSTGAATQNLAVSGTSTTTTGISEKPETSFIATYPNPNNGVFTINSTITLNAVVIITDMEGREVFSENWTGLNKQIDISNHADGIYIVSVISKTPNKKAQYKILLNK